MPIPQSAVDRYLSRQLEPLTWLKDLKPLEVEEALSHVRPRPHFRCPLRLDQKVLFLLGVAYPDVLFMTDLGTGKTAVSLELLSHLYEAEKIRRAFVFTPTDEISEGWEDEIIRWGFDIPRIRLTGSSQRKWAQLQSFGDGLVVGTYIGVAAMLSRLHPVSDADGQPTGRSRRQLVPSLVADAARGVDAVVYDQSTKLGSRSSLSFLTCEAFSRGAKFRYGLAGRAFGRDPFVLWGQLMLTDRGRALGASPGMFREAFWRRVQSPWGTKWVIRKRREPALGAMIAASSLRYSIEECVQLPPKVYVRRECTFPDENWQYYDQVREELLAARGNYREVKSSFLRMRQISSGFVGFRDDETGERAQIEFDANPKLDLLMSVVDELPADRKIVVFHEFTWSGARICQALQKAGYRFGWLWSGTKDWTSIKEAFNEDPEFRIVVANWRKASMGLNMQSASYEAFFESPVSAVERYESEGRIYRTGQLHKSMIYDLLVRDSADHRILEFHAEGKDLFKSLVEDPARYVGSIERRRR